MWGWSPRRRAFEWKRCTRTEYNDLLNSNKQKWMLSDTMKYSHPLHFHKFVMQLNEPKRDGGSAEHSFRALCWSQRQTYAKKYAWRAPMSRHVSLAWVTPFPPLLMMNDWACPGLVFHYDGQTGVSFLCIKGETNPRVTQGCRRQQERLGVYPTQASCFNPRMANVTVVLIYNGYTLFQLQDVPSLHEEIIQWFSLRHSIASSEITALVPCQPELGLLDAWCFQ